MVLSGLLPTRRPATPTRRLAPRARLLVEALESRVVPYAVNGGVWPSPQLITISFVPDGTIIGANNSGYVTSNLFATFNQRFGSAAKWQNVFLKAAQVWAQQTNVNFAIVGDNGATLGSGSYEQGDPNMGDIRISGYNFGNSNYLAMASLPPPANNNSIAGDISMNTGQTFNIGATYDLFSVAAHEIGHALGMGHSSLSSAIMYANYTTTRTALSSDDASGIRAVYGGGRAADAYTSDTSFSTAAKLNGQVSGSSAVVSGLDLVSTTDVRYFSFTAPSTTQLNVNLQAQNLSLFTSSVTVYDGNQNVVTSSSDAGQYGTTLSLSVNVTAGSTYYVKVTGADTTAFSTGTYALSLGFGQAAPSVAKPNTQTANGTSSSGSSSMGEGSGGLFGFLGGITGDLLGPLVGLTTSFGLGSAVGELSQVHEVEDGAPPAAPDPSLAAALQAHTAAQPVQAPLSAGVAVLSSTATVPVPTAVALPAPATLAPLPQTGGSSRPATIASEEDLAPTPATPARVAPAPGVTEQPPARGEGTRETPSVPEVAPALPEWSLPEPAPTRADDVCFAQPETLPSATHGEPISTPALAGVVLAIGGAWHLTREEEEELRRQRC